MRVSIADSNPRVCTAANMLLKFEPKLAIVGKAGHASRLLAQSKDRRPDPILLDLETLRKTLGPQERDSVTFTV